MTTLAHLLETSTPTDQETLILHAIRCSSFVQRQLAAEAELLPELLSTLHAAWTASAMWDWLAQQAIADEAALKRALRRLRRRVMLRTIVRDLNGLAGPAPLQNLDEVIQVTSRLAEVTLQCALQYLTPWLEAVHGVPVGVDGGRQALIVVGMGKLGGDELNVSSDIDLIFAFEEDGETERRGHESGKVLSNQEFFTRLGKKLIAAIDEITEDGFVFRVDMRLRPYGSEGPLACSFA